MGTTKLQSRSNRTAKMQKLFITWKNKLYPNDMTKEWLIVESVLIFYNNDFYFVKTKCEWNGVFLDWNDTDGCFITRPL